MRFLIRNQYLLLTLAVFMLGLILAQRQFAQQEVGHIERREDFLALHERGQKKDSEHLYQVLIQELPHLTLRNLADDLQRTAWVMGEKKLNPEDLVSKYHVSIRNELNRRAEQRLPRRPEPTQDASL
jgi:hypothetical protein